VSVSINQSWEGAGSKAGRRRGSGCLAGLEDLPSARVPPETTQQSPTFAKGQWLQRPHQEQFSYQLLLYLSLKFKHAAIPFYWLGLRFHYRSLQWEKGVSSGHWNEIKRFLKWSRHCISLPENSWNKEKLEFEELDYFCTFMCIMLKSHV